MEFLEECSENMQIAEALKAFLPDKLEKTTELEVRFGRIIDKGTQKRLAINMLHPCAIGGRSSTLWFESSVTEADFNEMKSYFDKNIATVQSKLIRDTMLKGERRSETREIDGKPVRKDGVLIKKIKRGVVDIFCPESKYDIRIGISEEIVKKDNLEMSTHCSVREKRRTTYTEESFVVDVTKVRAGANEKAAHHLTYEIEIEARNESYNKSQFIDIVQNSIKIIQKTLK